MFTELTFYRFIWGILLFICTVYASKCPSGTIYQPTTGTSFYWDLTNEVSTSSISNSNAQVFDLDLFYLTHEIVSLIHSLNRTLICYIDTAYEPFRNDSYKFTSAVLGKGMDGWPGQKVFFFLYSYFFFFLITNLPVKRF